MVLNELIKVGKIRAIETSSVVLIISDLSYDVLKAK